MLQDKIVIVTGANGALGRAAVALAAQQGAEVIALDLRFDGTPGARRFALDLTDAAATVACVAGLGRVDVVLNIAGGFAMGPSVHETTTEQWNHMARMNVDTARNVISAVVPGMLTRSREIGRAHV